MDFQRAPSSPHHQSNSPEPAERPAAKTKREGSMIKRQKQIILGLIILILLIAAAGTTAYYIHRYNQAQQQVKKLSSNPTVTAQQEQQNLIAKIGKLTDLPTGETPTVATVTDITKLKDQPFFANAKNGDKVLIYTQAKKAYLYRPSTNKLINIAPVNLGDQTGTTSTPTSTPKK